MERREKDTKTVDKKTQEPLSFDTLEWSVWPAGRAFRKEDFYDEACLIRSAELYAEVYAEDEELQALTTSAIEDWPE